jgi:hypothetical protein
MSAGQVTQGRRIADAPDGAGLRFSPGDYGRISATWFCSTPNGHMGNLENHAVTEHEDGTITVAPSILVMGTKDEQLWNGFLERGVWREA